ncbi:MAG: hypothetical protein E6J91_19110, partial [Deltaproteobacteria bacterium]
MPDAFAIDEVRGQVRALLERSPAFLAMSHPERAAFANSMVRVGSYLSRHPDRGAQPGTATALADPGGDQHTDPVEDLKGRLAQKQKLVGDEFHAGAVREGVEQF